MFFFFLDDNFLLKRWKIGLSFCTNVDSTWVAARGEYFAVVLCFTFLNFKNKTTETLDQLWSHAELKSHIKYSKGLAFWGRGWIWLLRLFRFTSGISSTCPVMPLPSGKQKSFCGFTAFWNTKPPLCTRFRWEGFLWGRGADTGIGWKSALPPCKIPNLKRKHKETPQPQVQRNQSTKNFFSFWAPPSWDLRGSWGSSSTQRCMSCGNCSRIQNGGGMGDLRWRKMLPLLLVENVNV